MSLKMSVILALFGVCSVTKLDFSDTTDLYLPFSPWDNTTVMIFLYYPKRSISRNYIKDISSGLLAIQRVGNW